MRIISFNANGIRATAKKGFFDWMATQDADVVCIQETKAQEEQLKGKEVFYPAGYHCFYEDSTVKKGYSGTAIYSRRQPDEVIHGIGIEEFDGEGRIIEARYGKLSVMSLYLPSGSSGDHRQASKDRFLDVFLPILRKRMDKKRKYIICGDWNIAHKKIDIKNWKSNQKNSGFLPHERAWMDELTQGVGYVDAFRVVNQEADQYTWWSNRGKAWENNVGWRIDYQIISPKLRKKVKAASIYRDQKFSDHAPLIIDYDYDF